MRIQNGGSKVLEGVASLFGEVLLETQQRLLRQDQVVVLIGRRDGVLKESWIEMGKQFPGNFTMSGNGVEVDGMRNAEYLKSLVMRMIKIWL